MNKILAAQYKTTNILLLIFKLWLQYLSFTKCLRKHFTYLLCSNFIGRDFELL